MKNRITIFAKAVVFLVGAAALSVWGILLPELAREAMVEDPNSTTIASLILAGTYVLAVPVFVALYHTYKFLNCIDQGQVFTQRAIRALWRIKICALIFGALAVMLSIVGIGLARSADPGADVTAAVAIGFLLMFASSVIAVFVAVLQRLLIQATALKSENDLIV